MVSGKLVEWIDIVEAELKSEDGSRRWKELYDATFDPEAHSAFESGVKDRNARVLGTDHTLTGKRLSERLAAAANSDKDEDRFLRERFEHWANLYCHNKIIELKLPSRARGMDIIGNTTINIPLEGDLTKRGDRYLLPPDTKAAQKGTLVGLPEVYFELEKPIEWLEHEAHLLWIPQRNGWVGVEFARWQETVAEQMVQWRGAYTLNEYCCEMVFKACRIPKGEISTEEVTHIEPSRLEEIAQNIALKPLLEDSWWGGMRIVHLTEYVLTPKEAMKYRRIHENWRRVGSEELGNFGQFKYDLGYLMRHCKGTFVAYHNGVLIGQSNDGDLLYTGACRLYDLPSPFKTDRLTVFKVPENTEGGLRDVEFKKTP